MAKIPPGVGPRFPQVVVLFGATGDLARRKLLPGLYHLATAGFIPQCRVIGVSLDDIDAVAELSRRVDLDVGEAGVFVDGVDATAAIRTAEVTGAVSKVAANSGVRTEMRARQQQWAAERGGGVIEGRDIGSVVFPDAELKLYLTASPRTRAERRVGEAGGDVDEIERAIAARDHYDSTRADSPLTEAAGSTLVDTTGLSVEEVLQHIVRLLEH